MRETLMMRSRLMTGAAALMLTGLLGACSEGGGRQASVLVDGSSTVYPVSEALAEEFQASTGSRVTVGLSGTGGGFRKFCRGEVHVTGASRPITTGEIESCAEAGIEFIELPIALDALANIVHPSNDWASCMTVEQLQTVWRPEAQGEISNWNQIDPSYPDQSLQLFGAGTDSGTYDYYTLAIVGTQHESRGDFTATEDDNVTIQGVSTNEGGLGFLGLAYLDQNQERVKPVAVRNPDGDCVEPSVETARNGTYHPLTRPLFLYVSRAALDEHQAVRDFMHFALDAEVAPDLVAEVGYVPLPDEAFAMGIDKIDERRTGSFFGGKAQVGVRISDLLQ
jgi:phosphate transport system substrate-binding protein